jgi:hypothetical protein
MGLYQLDNDPPESKWWRAQNYEIRDGCIRPTRFAVVRPFDPWSGDWEHSGRRIAEPPYVRLVELAHLLPTPGDDAVELTKQQETQLLKWCSENGLLGLLPHMVLHVSIVSASSPGTRGERVTMSRRYDEWFPLVEMDEEPTDQQPRDWPRSQVLLEPIGGGEPLSQSLTETWANFFPDVAAEEREAYDYPAPLTVSFWRQYAEPIGDFIRVAKYFAEAVARLSDLAADDFLTDLGGGLMAVITKDAARATLNGLMRPVSPVLHADDDDEFQRRWHSPSLLGVFAMMATQDLWGERRLIRCPCRKVVVSSDPRSKYCSPEHRVLYGKRSQRAQKREEDDERKAGIVRKTLERSAKHRGRRRS